MESTLTAAGSVLPSQVLPMIPGGEPSLQQIKKIGTDFESVFLSMLLKEMRNSLDEGFFGSESSDSFGGMFDMFIGEHLAKSNAIGIGDLLVQQYTRDQAGEERQEPSKISFSA